MRPTRILDSMTFGLRGRTILAAVANLALAAGLAMQPAEAADLRSGRHLVVRASETIQDDLYAAYQTVQIVGTIEGDLVVVGEQVSVTGTVHGDLVVLGETVTLSGPVHGVVRVLGGRVNLDSSVEFDAILAGGETTVGPGAHVGRDVLLMFGEAEVSGRVVRHVRAWTDALALGPTASIGGNVEYSGGRRLARDPKATVTGAERQLSYTTSVRKTPLTRWLDDAGAWMKTLFGLLMVGVLFAGLAPSTARDAANTITGSPWSSMGLGIALFVLVPVAVVPMTLLGLVLGGWWIGLATLALWLIAMPIAYLTTSFRVGMSIRGLLPSGLPGAMTGPVATVLVGLVVLELAACLPYAGWGVRVGALLCGLGALGLTTARAVRRNRSTPELVSLTTTRAA